MTTLIVDANVAVKWCLPMAREPLTDESLRLLKRSSRRNEIEFIVPDIFWVELGERPVESGTRRAQMAPGSGRRSRMSFMRESRFSQRVVDWISCQRPWIWLSPTIDPFTIVLYVALAIQSKSEMITADERLANALAARFPVKWLGAF